MSDRPNAPSVGLFVTCLVDSMRPSVGFAALRLLEAAGYRVEVPAQQTCCGQPGFNSGDHATARVLAERVVAAFEPFDYVVAPSGSCMGMIKTHYADVFRTDPPWRERHAALSARCFELLSFLVDVAGFVPDARYGGKVTYHHSCSALRELGVKRQPEHLLDRVEGLDYVALAQPEACCGFGGTFCVKYGDISTAIADDKVDDIRATGADTLLGGDMGCLMNIQGRLARRGIDVKVRHAAEVLAGTDAAPLGRGGEP